MPLRNSRWIWWHLPDPIAWRKECRITIRQIAWQKGLAETEDDWSCATFWYEPVSSEKLPDVKARTPVQFNRRANGSRPLWPARSPLARG